ncbi:MULTISPECIES: hypothetical protein [unclassified Pseudoalteromonas]|uniref:hypothetical protein n=1 Tax=unclassified Pseudoalteromonas TaxID=194690 RepID=UPI00140B7646|nr:MULTISPECIES: hypothetical protein [unclassified Pseudoalteromonas]MBH0028180.1 hypothetical protein [Pseudoalteromonas sp. SWN29]
MDIEKQLESWVNLYFPMEGIEKNTKAFTTHNKKRTKEGLFSYPNHILTLEEEAKYSEQIFQDLINLGHEVDIDFGDDLGSQQDSIKNGIKGIVHWYVCNWFKTETLKAMNKDDSNAIPYLSLMAVYHVNGEKLFLGSLFRLLTRQTGYPHYSVVGQVICTYIEWCKAKRDLDFSKLDRCAHALFAHGMNMAKAEYEYQIIAGKSRTSEATSKRVKTKEEKKQLAIMLLPKVIKEMKQNNANLNITWARVSERVASKMDEILKPNKPTPRTTVEKNYLKGINLKSYK